MRQTFSICACAAAALLIFTAVGCSDDDGNDNQNNQSNQSNQNGSDAAVQDDAIDIKYF